MLHSQRVWAVKPVPECDVEKLAEDLTEMTWCGCCGFELAKFYLLNDSTSPDGAQEYAIVRKTDLKQVESVTFGWMSEKETLEYLKSMADGSVELCDFKFQLRPDQIQTPEEHGRCYLCM